MLDRPQQHILGFVDQRRSGLDVDLARLIHEVAVPV